MVEPNQAQIKISELYQVGIVVHDLEKSMERYEKAFGIGPWDVINVDSSMFSEMTYHGKPVQHRFRAALTMVGPMQLELIEPIDGDNIYSDFLKEHGEGLHHLGHVRVSNLDEAIQSFEKEGFPCLQSGRSSRAGVAYMDTTKALGFIIELLEMSEGVPAPGRG